MEKIKPDIIYNYLSSLFPNAKCALNYNNDYELLISIILSAQTTDKAVNSITPKLFQKYMDINSLANAKLEDVEAIIKPIGLYKNKALNIINTAKTLNDLGYKNIPNDYSLLISLSGVGNKTSNVFLAEYYDEQKLGVDTHIARISKRLGLSKEKDDVLKIEKNLTSFFKDYHFKKVHHMLITFGRNICTSKNPKCEDCLLNKYCKMSGK